VIDRFKTDFTQKDQLHVVVGPIRPNVPCDYRICRSLLERYRKNGPEYKFRLLRLVPEVLKEPFMVFEDLKRDGEENSVCIVGRPANTFDNEGNEIPFPDGFLFLVFADGDRKVTDWRIEQCDSSDQKFPQKHAERFGRNLWSNERK